MSSRLQRQQRKRLKRIEQVRRILLRDASGTRVSKEDQNILANVGRHVDLQLVPLQPPAYPHLKNRSILQGKMEKWNYMKKLISEGWDRGK